MKQPTKEELKAKYNISESDFEILHEFSKPDSEKLIKEGAYLEKAGWFEGVEVWLKRTFIGGCVLAIILVGSFISGIGAIADFGQTIYVHREVMGSYISEFADYAKEQTNTFLVSESPTPTEEDKRHMTELNQWAIMPTGSQFAPLSGSYQV
jgi:hypothetical protein